MGQIPEANQTYNVIGNMNEHALSIGETTAGGLEILQAQDDAIMDYGSLIWWVDGWAQMFVLIHKCLRIIAKRFNYTVKKYI